MDGSRLRVAEEERTENGIEKRYVHQYNSTAVLFINLVPVRTRWPLGFATVMPVTGCPIVAGIPDERIVVLSYAAAVMPITTV